MLTTQVDLPFCISGAQNVLHVGEVTTCRAALPIGSQSVTQHLANNPGLETRSMQGPWAACSSMGIDRTVGEGVLFNFEAYPQLTREGRPLCAREAIGLVSKGHQRYPLAPWCLLLSACERNAASFDNPHITVEGILHEFSINGQDQWDLCPPAMFEGFPQIKVILFPPFAYKEQIHLHGPHGTSETA